MFGEGGLGVEVWRVEVQKGEGRGGVVGIIILLGYEESRRSKEDNRRKEGAAPAVSQAEHQKK